MAGTSYNGPAFDSGDLKELKQKLVDGCHILDREGITDGFGHVSVRVPGSEAFLTLAGVSPGCATPERLVMLDFDGRYLGGAKAPPPQGDAGVGASLEQAVLRTIQLAFVGELAHLAVAHGEPLYLTAEEMAAFAADQAFPARPWEYYLS